ncbi:Inactive protein kinase [Vitis vinifera]|uniref:Inactive protein kinase n=1 Tax=Vitis vinifera TaxID=29760 RepID=A0A438K1Y4_VITVI|nr:Inactive protein kinase [Vitis vinifera]
MFPVKVEGNVKQQGAGAATEKVVVAVRAERVISKTALAWALSHVVHAGDCITLLAVFATKKTGRRLWNFPRLTGDCANSHRERLPDRICEISESCSQMVLQFNDQVEVRVRIKVVSGTPGGAVAAEAKSNGANWVILDKKLKQELKHCMEELHCNIVVMKGSQPKVLRLNLGSSNELQTPFFSASSSPDMENRTLQGHKIKHSTPVSSPEDPRLNKGKYRPVYEDDSDEPPTALDCERLITLSAPPASSVKSDHQSVFWIPQNHIVAEKAPLNKNSRSTQKMISPSRTLLDKFVEFDKDTRIRGPGSIQTRQRDYSFDSTIREAVPLGRTSSKPPPLCSLCQHKAPVFGKPPRQFAYEELQEATNGFSDENFLAEGGFGWFIGGAEKWPGGCSEAVKGEREYWFMSTYAMAPWTSIYMVADFGLARWHSNWDINTEERLIGTSGYLAPEYLDGGKITQKVDVYAFGVVLLELMTGQRARDLQFYRGRHFLPEWIHPLPALQPSHILANNYQLVDPCLASDELHDFPYQLQAMGCAASLCLRQDPESRPTMSKVFYLNPFI